VIAEIEMDGTVAAAARVPVTEVAPNPDESALDETTLEAALVADEATIRTEPEEKTL